jgi:hypothetical protein
LIQTLLPEAWMPGAVDIVLQIAQARVPRSGVRFSAAARAGPQLQSGRAAPGTITAQLPPCKAVQRAGRQPVPSPVQRDGRCTRARQPVRSLAALRMLYRNRPGGDDRFSRVCECHRHRHNGIDARRCFIVPAVRSGRQAQCTALPHAASG